MMKYRTTTMRSFGTMLSPLLPRALTTDLRRALETFPAVGIVGPRQCGKSTLVRELLFAPGTPVRHLDLKRPSDLAQLERPKD